jgi:hypothetical protein
MLRLSQVAQLLDQVLAQPLDPLMLLNGLCGVNRPVVREVGELDAV